MPNPERTSLWQPYISLNGHRQGRHTYTWLTLLSVCRWPAVAFRLALIGECTQLRRYDHRGTSIWKSSRCMLNTIAYSINVLPSVFMDILHCFVSKSNTVCQGFVGSRADWLTVCRQCVARVSIECITNLQVLLSLGIMVYVNPLFLRIRTLTYHYLKRSHTILHFSRADKMNHIRTYLIY